MPDKYPYYKIRKSHLEIFGRQDPVSIFELLFAVEAPEFISDINIWEYCERFDLEEFDQNVQKISREELDLVPPYPFYELFMELWAGKIRCPLIFDNIEEYKYLHCVEGRHRLRVMLLFYQADPGMFNQVIGGIPGVHVDLVEWREDKGCPAEYNQWMEWLSQNNIISNSFDMRRTYAKLLLGK